MSFEDLLRHKITILRPSITYDAAGDASQPEDSPTTVATGVRCLIQQRSGQWKSEQRGESGDDGLICFLGKRTDIRGGDFVQVTTGPEFLQPVGDTTEKFHVELLDDAGGQGHHLEVRLMR